MPHPRESPPASVFPALAPLLARVNKPVQYVGGELNSQIKEWNVGGPTTVRWALLYPDAYEVGLPNQGLMILYEVLNEQPDVLAERTYTVWPDLEALMRDAGVPQFTVDAHRPVRAFDLLGVSFATELGYTNFLTALDLAGIPLEAARRGSRDPVVVAGGHAAFNPEPLADFLDAVVLGDGEEAVLAISRLVREWKAAGRPGGRAGLLGRLARSGVAYVPGLYEVSYSSSGAIAQVRPRERGVPARVAKHTLMDLDSWPYPRRPLVPLAESVHERMSVEIFRGCTRGCRFCQAGMITRPVRERSITGIAEMVECGLAATGYAEVGLLSLSSADHSEIAEIARGLADRYEGTRTSLSLPSTRVDAFNVTLAEELARGGRRSGLTFAPEGGSERLRRVINKTVSREDLLRTVTTAYRGGWRQVKLYFMCGLPTETDEDVLEIAELARAVVRAGREATGARDIRCTVSIGGFVPKPHTPFQWAAQLGHEATDRRLALLRAAIGRDRAIGFRYHDGRPGIVEGLLSRGDRRVGATVRRAWELGARFDGWREHFDFDRWMLAAAQTLSEHGVDVDWYTTRERPLTEVLPWDHLDAGLNRDWLWADWQDALATLPLDDCRWVPCYDCGVCPSLGTEIQVGPTGRTVLPLAPLGPPAPPAHLELLAPPAHLEPLEPPTPPEPRAASGASPVAARHAGPSTSGPASPPDCAQPLPVG